MFVEYELNSLRINHRYLRIGQPGGVKCNASNLASLRLQLGDNTVYALGASVLLNVNVCGKTMNRQQWIATGADKCTPIKDSATLTSATIGAIGLAALAKP